MSERYPLHNAEPIPTNLPETMGPNISDPNVLPPELQKAHQLQSHTEPEQIEQDEPEQVQEQQETNYNQDTPDKRQRRLKANEYTNAANLRRQLEEAQRERDMALQKLQDSADGILGDDDLVDGKSLKSVKQEIKDLKNQLINARIKSQYADFDSVVTVDNLNILRDSYPEIMETLRTSNDTYTQACSAYTLIKKLGIIPNQQDMQNRARVQVNSNKPRPAVSVGPQQGDSPLSKANAFDGGLTPELKKQLHKEMEEYRKRY
jgi:hypothetical protein